jgi:hypothetical protein
VRVARRTTHPSDRPQNALVRWKLPGETQHVSQPCEHVRRAEGVAQESLEECDNLVFAVMTRGKVPNLGAHDRCHPHSLLAAGIKVNARDRL